MNYPFYGKRKWTNLTPAQQRAFVRAFNAGEACSVHCRKGSKDEARIEETATFTLKSKDGVLYVVPAWNGPPPTKKEWREFKKRKPFPLSYTATVYISPFR